MWHVSSRSGAATLRTAIHLLLTYCTVYTGKDKYGELRIAAEGVVEAQSAVTKTFLSVAVF